MRFKKSLSILLAAVTLASLGTGAFTVSADESEPTKVVFWNRIFEDWYVEFFDEYVEAYNNAGRDYQIEMVWVADDAWNERMSSAQAGGTAPDMYIITFDNIASYARDGLILPITEYYPEEVFEDMFDYIQEAAKVDGEYYGIPQELEAQNVLFYRKDMFEEAGITELPTTWEELYEAARKLTNENTYGIGIPALGDMQWMSLGYQYNTAGHWAISENWDEGLVDESYMELATFYKTLYDEGLCPEVPLAGTDKTKDLCEGSVAMKYCGSWGISEIINDYPEMADKFGVMIPPTLTGDQETPFSICNGWNYVVDAKSENAKGVADFVSWLMFEDVERAAAFYKLADLGKISCFQSVTDYTLENFADECEWYPTIQYIIDRSVLTEKYPWEINTAVGVMIENACLGTMSVEDAAAQAQAEIESIITNQNLAGTNPNMQ